MFEQRSLDATLSGPSGLGLVNNTLNALCLLSGREEGACLAEDVAAGGMEDRWFKMTTQAGVSCVLRCGSFWLAGCAEHWAAVFLG